MKAFSKHWKKSKKARKKRNYASNATFKIKEKFLGAHLSKELKAKYSTRSIRIRTGDKVKVLRGQFKGKDGKVENVDIKTTKITIAGIEQLKKDGTKSLYKIHPSNVIITVLDLDDKKRMKSIVRKSDSKKSGKSSKTEEKPKGGKS